MSKRVWMDIENESVRKYILPDGNILEFINPVRVGIKRVTLADGSYKDSHSVRCADGAGGYVKEFTAIGWESGLGESATDESFSDRVNAALQDGDE